MRVDGGVYHCRNRSQVGLSECGFLRSGGEINTYSQITQARKRAVRAVARAISRAAHAPTSASKTSCVCSCVADASAGGSRGKDKTARCGLADFPLFFRFRNRIERSRICCTHLRVLVRIVEFVVLNSGIIMLNGRKGDLR
jgi:hypothetical protein